ncbi:MAG: bifunctional DNA primase/polymerase [Isosphaeraceae bacterium]
MPTFTRPNTEGIRTDADVRQCREAMHFYRREGYQPLPSRTDRKAPCCPYGDHWESPVPKHVYDCYRTSNTQVMTGVHWNLVVVDLDGPIAIEAWRAMTLYREIPPTWEVYSDPYGGRHLWFSVPPGVEAIPPSTFVWRLDGADHANIEVIGDRRLIMAPPSIHPATGRRYRFADGHAPRDMRKPAECPAWILDLPSVDASADMSAPERTPATPYVGPRPSGSYAFADVIEAIPDGEVAGLVRSWGVRVASSKPNSKGWWQCHSIRRDDQNPSAGINERVKCYVDLQSREKLSLFGLAVARGVFGSVSEACNCLGERYGARNT